MIRAIGIVLAALLAVSFVALKFTQWEIDAQYYEMRREALARIHAHDAEFERTVLDTKCSLECWQRLEYWPQDPTCTAWLTQLKAAQ